MYILDSEIQVVKATLPLHVKCKALCGATRRLIRAALCGYYLQERSEAAGEESLCFALKPTWTLQSLIFDPPQ